MRTLKISAVARHWKLTTTNWEPLVKLILLQLHENLLKNSMLTILQPFSIWSKLEGWKNSVSGCLVGWPEIKNRSEVSSSLALRQRQTISRSDCNMRRKVSLNKFVILYDNWRWPAQWLDWEAAPNHFLKPKLHQKKVMVTVWWSAACLIHYSFLNPGKTITSEKYAQQIDEMHQKPQLPAAGIGQQHRLNSSPQQHPNTCRTTNASKVEQIGLWSFCLICHIHLTSHQLITTSSRTTLQGKHFQNEQKAENAFQEFVESRSMDFYATGINKLIFLWQKCVAGNDFYFN